MRTREDGVRQVSHSEIRTFKECRRRWWLGYQRRLVRDRESLGAASLGSRVHAALATLYEAEHASQHPGANIDPTYVMWTMFDAQADRDRQAYAEAEEDSTDLLKEIELARIMVEGYVEWLAEEGADSDLVVEGVEEAVEVASPHPGVNLVAKMDLRVRRISDGMRFFLDHKTVQEFTTPERILHLDEQMLMYHLIERLAEVEQPTGGALYNMLRKVKRSARAKPPFYRRKEVYHTDVELRSFYYRIYGVLHDMLEVEAQLAAGADPNQVAYPTPTRDCTWKCQFFAVCPMFDDGSAAEDVLAMGYREGDPYARYGSDLGSEII